MAPVLLYIAAILMCLAVPVWLTRRVETALYSRLPAEESSRLSELVRAYLLPNLAASFSYFAVIAVGAAFYGNSMHSIHLLISGFYLLSFLAINQQAYGRIYKAHSPAIANLYALTRTVSFIGFLSAGYFAIAMMQHYFNSTVG